MSAISAPSQGPGTNTGHGHVWKRPDKAVARCGGPGLCKRCAADKAEFGDTLPEQLDRLRAERDRYAAALTQIASMYRGSQADFAVNIAQKALES